MIAVKPFASLLILQVASEGGGFLHGVGAHDRNFEKALKKNYME